MKNLTPRQAAFVREYLIDLNGTQAAIRAGYSAKTANEQASRLLAHVSVAAAVQAAMDARSERTEITADRVLAELAKVGFSDIRKLFDDDGKMKHVTMLDDETAAFVSSIKVVANKANRADGENEQLEVENTLEIKVWDKLSALEKLGRHLKLFGADVNLNLGDDLARWLGSR